MVLDAKSGKNMGVGKSLGKVDCGEVVKVRGPAKGTGERKSTQNVTLLPYCKPRKRIIGPLNKVGDTIVKI